MTVDMLVVFAIIFLALVLFATEFVPIDVTAILVMVLLMVLGPWTQISPREGISGFSSPATITVLAMLILSTGISRTGVVQMLGQKMTEFAATIILLRNKILFQLTVDSALLDSTLYAVLKLVIRNPTQRRIHIRTARARLFKDIARKGVSGCW